MVIIKNRDTAVDWVVWFSSLTSGNFMKLNDSVAESSSSRIFQNGFTTSTFGIGANNSVNKSSDDLVAYCFNNVQGFSKCGAYEGNGQRDGVFVYLGFQPAFVMIKNMDNSGRWTMFDNKRTIANGDFEYLVADDDHAESDAGLSFTDPIDFLSNGFKQRNSDAFTNGSSTYVFMAFAQHPLVTSKGIPTTAR